MSSQNKRVTGKEQYYTPEGVVERCMEIMGEYLEEGGKYLEPAGGTGAFVSAYDRDWETNFTILVPL